MHWTFCSQTAFTAERRSLCIHTCSQPSSWKTRLAPVPLLAPTVEGYELDPAADSLGLPTRSMFISRAPFGGRVLLQAGAWQARSARGPTDLCSTNNGLPVLLGVAGFAGLEYRLIVLATCNLVAIYHKEHVRHHQQFRVGAVIGLTISALALWPAMRAAYSSPGNTEANRQAGHLLQALPRRVRSDAQQPT